MKTARRDENEEFVGIPTVGAFKAICLNSLFPLILGLAGYDLCAWGMLLWNLRIITFCLRCMV